MLLEKDQVIIKLEAKVEEAKEKGDAKAMKLADSELVKANELKNIALNFVETRNALASAKADVRNICSSIFRKFKN
jgi:hypothetical protein